MDGAEETLVAKTYKADGEILPGKEYFGAIREGLMAGVHAKAELLRLGMGD